MSSLAVDQGLEGLEHWLAGLFTAAELAAADLLLRLSGDDAAASTSTTRSSSPRSVSTCREEISVDQEAEDLAVEKEEAEERAFEEPAVSTELDRRASKRYRLLSDLYASTIPVSSASASSAAAKKKRKMRHLREDGPSSSVVEATRYGGDY